MAAMCIGLMQKTRTFPFWVNPEQENVLDLTVGKRSLQARIQRRDSGLF